MDTPLAKKKKKIDLTFWFASLHWENYVKDMEDHFEKKHPT